jgi:DNA-binding MarR family transcriptional regulator
MGKRAIPRHAEREILNNLLIDFLNAYGAGIIRMGGKIEHLPLLAVIYRASYRDRIISLKSILAQSQVPRSTAQRWLADLEQHGIVVRRTGGYCIHHNILSREQGDYTDIIHKVCAAAEKLVVKSFAEKLLVN